MLALHRPHNCQQAIMNVAGALQHLWMPLLQQSLIWLVLAKKQPPVMLLLMNGKTFSLALRSRRDATWPKTLKVTPYHQLKVTCLPFRQKHDHPLEIQIRLLVTLQSSVWPRSFAVPGIERCPVRTVAIFSWSSCDTIAADRRGLSTNASAQEKGDTVAGARLGAAPWQAGLRWFRNCLQVSTRDFGPGSRLKACVLMKLV